MSLEIGKFKEHSSNNQKDLVLESYDKECPTLYLKPFGGRKDNIEDGVKRSFYVDAEDDEKSTKRVNLPLHDLVFEGFHMKESINEHHPDPYYWFQFEEKQQFGDLLVTVKDSIELAVNEAVKSFELKTRSVGRKRKLPQVDLVYPPWFSNLCPGMQKEDGNDDKTIIFVFSNVLFSSLFRMYRNHPFEYYDHSTNDI